jgi:hypothetical protein
MASRQLPPFGNRNMPLYPQGDRKTAPGVCLISQKGKIGLQLINGEPIPADFPYNFKGTSMSSTPGAASPMMNLHQNMQSGFMMFSRVAAMMVMGMSILVHFTIKTLSLCVGV